MLMYMLFTIHRKLEKDLDIVTEKEGQAMNRLLNRVVDSVQSRKAEDTPLNQIISEELIRAAQEESRPLTDQSKANDHENLFNSIIAPGKDIDNNEVFDRTSGETIKDLGGI